MDLLERADDEAAIAHVIANACNGSGGSLVVEAPAGLGKTALLTRAATAGSVAGMRALSASGDMMEQDLPWGLVLQLFSYDLALGADLVTPVDDLMLSNPLAILYRIHREVVDLADVQSLLLVIDDLHWADLQSLQCVHYLARRIEHLPVAMLAAVRRGNVRAEVSATLEGMAACAGGAHRTLVPLSDSAIETLARRYAPSAPATTIRAIAQAVGGNPFLCREVATQRGAVIEPRQHGGVRADGDLRRLQLWVRARLGETGPVALRAAQAIAVLGRQATAPRVAAVADAAIAEVAECLDSLHRGGFVDVDSHLIRFRHPVLREVVYSATGPTSRRELHHRCARLLADQGSVQEAGTHLLASGPRGEAWELATLRAAALADLAAAAADRAVRFLRSAVALAQPDERGRVLLELGRAELLAGDTAASADLREALRSLADRPTTVLQQVGDWLLCCGLFDDAAHAYRLGLDNLPPGTDRVAEAQLIASLHSADLFSGRYPDRTNAAVALVAADPPSDPDAADRILLASAAGESAISLDRPRGDVLALARRAVAGLRPSELGRALLEPIALAFYSCDEFGEARRLVEDFIKVAAGRGEFVANTSLKAIRSLCCFRMGDLDQAELDANDVLAMVGTHPAARAQMVGACYAMTLTYLERNELGAAERALDVDVEHLWGNGWLQGWYWDARGRVELARGRPEAACDAFARAGARLSAPGGAGMWADWRCGAAMGMYAAGDLGRARACVQEAHQLAVQSEVPTRIASALRTQAKLEKDPAAQARLLWDAVEQLEHSEAILDRAHVLVDLGSAQRRMGRRRDCREVLRRGGDLARRCGAWALADHAADELAASGARRPARAITGIDALTPAERRVAEFAAAGRSNREIAELLFVTRKTVEVHLGSVYRKLGISGRGDLAGRQWRDPTANLGVAP